MTPSVSYISWAPNCSRSDHTARELGGRSHMVYLARFGSKPTTILFKYLGQWIETARILRHEQPDSVFVMSPPVFAALPAFWYAWRRRKRVVVDAHTAAFLSQRWRFFQWLQMFLCRRAATTLVSNEHLAQLVRAAGGHATLVPDVPVIFPYKKPFPRPDAFSVAVVCSFDYDEPVAEIFDAAARVPDVSFFVTGNASKLPADLKARMPGNVHLTGYLSDEAYGGLLSTADVVMALTTYDHTMLRGAYEAIYQGTPVIVSDWRVLRDAFPFGAAHVDNSADQIAAAIRSVREHHDRFREDAARLCRLKLARWEETRRLLLTRLESGL